MAKERHTLIPSVYLVLIKNNKILLLRRFNTGFMDGYYSLPAGHVESNETLTSAMVREAKEEIGIKINKKDLKLAHIIHRKEPNEERINFFFVSQKYQGKPKIMEPHKCDDLNWFDLNDLPESVIPYIKQAIQNILAKKIYSEFGWKKAKK